MANCKILLVDDDIEDYIIMQQAFADLGVGEILKYIDNGPKALAFLEDAHRANQGMPCIVVLDINMPVMSGTQVLQKMRADERFRKLPVVIYSTAINPNDKTQCAEMGAEYCITKPGNLEEIIAVSQTLLSLCRQRDPLKVQHIT